MKNITNFINERLHLTSKQQYSCQPKTKSELQEIIIQRIKEEGNECDLNDIDVSKIDDMSRLFNADDNEIFRDFNGDISQWNVSNVKYMKQMFYRCYEFNCDLSRWNVSNVKIMIFMFGACKKFNCDLSRWDVSNVEDIACMFFNCTNFNQNLDMWKVSNVKEMYNAFYDCPTQPEWYEEKL